MRINESNILSRLNFANWILLGALTLGGMLIGTTHIAGSILCGGLIAITNYYWLASVLRRVLRMPAGQAGRFAQVRYVVRLFLLGVVLWFLITTVQVHIPGLLLGLSLIVMNITAFALYLVARKGG
ncbi:ATP synthase I chain [Geobacter sp. DSM 9736]|nr:ATP synthase I chain [Geobacter sp. DSM 9736]